MKSLTQWGALAVFALLASPALAETSSGQPDFFWQPTVGQFALTPALVYSSDSTKLKSGGLTTTDTTTDTSLALGFDYGLVETLSLGIKLTQTSRNHKTKGATPDKYTASGLTDVLIRTNGFWAQSGWTFRYGAELTWSPGDKKTNSSGHPTNLYSGGNRLVPYIGADWQLGAWNVGTKLQQELGIGDSKTKNVAGTTTTSGGEATILTVYGENELQAGMKLGASLSYAGAQSGKIKTSTGTADYGIITYSTLTAYGAFEVQDGIEILPEIAYAFPNQDSNEGSKVTSASKLELAVAGRFTF